MTQSPLIPRTTTLPWLAALLVGATVHVGWLAHEVMEDEAPPVVVVPAPTVLVVDGDGVPQTAERAAADRSEALACRAERKRKHKRKHKKRARKERRERRERTASAESGMTGTLLPAGALSCDDETHCTLSRAALRALVDNPSRLARAARIVPAKADGEQIGFKIFGVRRDSLPGQFGLRNGDLLTSLQGKPLTSIDACMQVYETMRPLEAVDTIEIGLLRKGEPVTIEVQLR
ncbi:MAG: hypothetical protein AAF721_10210 [Myxococcota bacterium]